MDPLPPSRRVAPPTEQGADSRAEIVRAVGDALGRIYDLPYLQTHPLIALLGLTPRSGGASAGRLLQRRLLDVIQALGPSTREAAERKHRILSLRYLDGLEVAAIQRELAIGRSQYYREHQKALAAVASLLWDWSGQGRATEPASFPAREIGAQPGLTPLVGGGFAPVPSLPIPLTSFVGRDVVMAEAQRLLATSRLLTLTGPPGAGKTRLALELAAQGDEQFPDGVYFVPLAALEDPDLVVPTIAQALGVRAYGSRPLEESLVGALRSRDVLLVLDNLEQIVEAGPAIARLLQGCPRLRALATSRVPLHVSGEQEFPVPPLALPGREAPRRDATASSPPASVALFLDRAQRVSPNFRPNPEELQLIGQICADLDGLPLAIELAAARSNVLSPQALAARLGSRLALLTGGPRDSPARHRTLRDAIAWSYDLLDPSEQALFEQLSVFAGGWTLEAAESVTVGAAAGARGDHETSPSPRVARSPDLSVLDGLATLVDGSLVRRDLPADGEPRFMMLETIREFARERLAARGLAARGNEDAFRDRHADYFLAFAEHAATFWQTPYLALRLGRVARELDNLRTAIDRLETRDAERTLRLTAALGLFWFVRGTHHEGSERLGAALSASGPSHRSPARALALDALALLAMIRGDLDEATTHQYEALAIYREQHDLQAVGRAYGVLGRIALARPETTPRAAALAEHRLAIVRAVGSASEVATGLFFMGRVLRRTGHLDEARAHLEESLARFQKAGSRGRGLRACLTELAWLAVDRGEVADAGPLLEGIHRISRDLGQMTGIAEMLDVSAALNAAEGTGLAAVRALRLAGAAHALREAIGVPPDWYEQAELERQLTRARALIDGQAAAAAWAAGRELSPEEAIAETLGSGG